MLTRREQSFLQKITEILVASPLMYGGCDLPTLNITLFRQMDRAHKS